MREETTQIQKGKNSKWLFVLTVLNLLLIVLFSLTVFPLLGEMAYLKQSVLSLQEGNLSLEQSLSRTENALREEMEARMNRQESLLASERCDISGWDLAAGTVRFALYAVPKRYDEGKTVRFIAVSAGESVSAEARAGEDGVGFYAELTCPLSDDIALYAELESDGVTERQQIEQMYDLESGSVPGFTGSVSGIVNQCHEGHLLSNVSFISVRIWSHSRNVLGKSVCEDQVEGVFYINGEEYAVYEAYLEKSNEADLESIYKAMTPVDLLLAEGDVFTAAVRVTDNYGRVFEETIVDFVVENGEIPWG